MTLVVIRRPGHEMQSDATAGKAHSGPRYLDPTGRTPSAFEFVNQGVAV